MVRNLFKVLEVMTDIGTKAILSNEYQLNVPVLLEKVYLKL